MILAHPALIPKNPGGKLQQYFSPEWVSLALVDRFFPHLCSNDVVCEPTCGRGSFLKAVPEHVRAFGIEIDPELAEEARRNSGRPVITGDFRIIDLPERPTHLIGNPPFKKAVVDDLLRWASKHLPENGQAGFILAAYHMQFSSSVMEWHREWSINHTLIPKEIFPGIKHPLSFVVFEKKTHRTLHGMFLYEEADSIRGLGKPAKLILHSGRPRVSAWRALVESAIDGNGGTADLQAIYVWCGDKRPTQNPWWKQRIRNVCQTHCIRTAPGIYAKLAA